MFDYLMTEREVAAVEAQRARCVRIFHYYDLGNQSVYLERYQGDVDPMRAAMYCVFMAEQWFDTTEVVASLTIAACLCAFYGFRHIAATSISTRVDMHFDRERLCGKGCAELMADTSLHRDGLREFMARLLDSDQAQQLDLATS